MGELRKFTANSVRYFLTQHVSSATHQGNLRLVNHIDGEKKIKRCEVECEGLRTDDIESGGNLHKFRYEFELWARFANFKATHARHTYKRCGNSDVWTVRSHHCLEVCEKIETRQVQICSECYKLGTARQIIRCSLRFAMKYHAAQLLSARIFQSETEAANVEASIKEAALYRFCKRKVADIIELDVPRLQQYVRSSWLCDWKASDAQKAFLQNVVTPSLRINVSSVPSRMADVIARFTGLIRSGQADETEVANLKIACAAISGTFEGHPLLLGLALQCKRALEKQNRGVATLAGRRSQESEVEAQLISDAGVQLAALCGNSTLAREFGIAASALRTKMSDLPRCSLPVPALALNFLEVLKENFHIINQRYVMPQGNSKRYLDDLGCVSIVSAIFCMFLLSARKPSVHVRAVVPFFMQSCCYHHLSSFNL